MSDRVERRLIELLDGPTVSPFGNAIPGLGDLVPGLGSASDVAGDHPGLDRIAGDEPVRVTVRRIGEVAQEEDDLLRRLARAGVVPGAVVRVQRSPGGVLVGSAGEYVELPVEVAAGVHVEPLA
jgi:DtxR family Mn-dependent transcriptional regulator